LDGGWAGDDGYQLQHNIYNVSYSHDTTRACRYLGLCRSVKRLSVSDVDIDDGLSQALAHMTACYAIISETNLHCSHLAALSASVASACAASYT